MGIGALQAAHRAIHAALVAEAKNLGEKAPSTVTAHTPLDCHWKFRVAKKALESKKWAPRRHVVWVSGNLIVDLTNQYEPTNVPD